MKEKAPTHFNIEDCTPSLREAIAGQPFDFTKSILVAFPVKPPESSPEPQLDIKDRTRIYVSDGTCACPWVNASLRALYRGNAKPPVLGDEPEDYAIEFALLEMHVLELASFIGDPRDEEMLEIYSCLRRRPDGKSMGQIHDYMWQAACLILGSRPLSQAEFEAILSRLERSCRTFRMGPGSRNYISTLRMTFGDRF